MKVCTPEYTHTYIYHKRNKESQKEGKIQRNDRVESGQEEGRERQRQEGGRERRWKEGNCSGFCM